MGVEHVKRRPEAEDVADPVQRHPGEPEPVRARAADQAHRQVERVEAMAEMATPAAARRTEAASEAEYEKSQAEPCRNADQPGEGQARTDSALIEVDDARRDRGRRREDGVLERAEPEHPRACFLLRQPGPLQRRAVERNPPAWMNTPKPVATIAAAFGASSCVPPSARTTSR